MYDMREIERMTVHEYTLRMTAYKLSSIDKKENIHLLAWKINEAKAERMQGKKAVRVFKTFDSFFKRDEYEQDVLGLKKEPKLNKKTHDMFLKANS